jgi:predicted N-acetyltransferase YhbS
VILRALQPADDRTHFSCGDPDCDDYLRRYAGQNQFEHRISTTLVIVEEEQVVGYAAFSIAALSRDDLPPEARQGLPAYPLPALRLGRLAVDARFQGVGLGSKLVAAVLGIALRLRSELGCSAVLVDALPSSVGFYERLGFERIAAERGRSRVPASVPMILPLVDVAAATEE